MAAAPYRHRTAHTDSIFHLCSLCWLPALSQVGEANESEPLLSFSQSGLSVVLASGNSPSLLSTPRKENQSGDLSAFSRVGTGMCGLSGQPTHRQGIKGFLLLWRLDLVGQQPGRMRRPEEKSKQTWTLGGVDHLSNLAAPTHFKRSPFQNGVPLAGLRHGPVRHWLSHPSYMGNTGVSVYLATPEQPARQSEVRATKIPSVP